MSPAADEERTERPHGDTVLAGASPSSGTGAAILLLAAGAPPAIWFLHLNVSYLLVPPSCRTGSAWPIAAATVVALLAMALPAHRSWRIWQRDGGSSLVGLLGGAGLLLTCVFVLAVVAVGGAALIVDPCR